jgi:hypothetical protein
MIPSPMMAVSVFNGIVDAEHCFDRFRFRHDPEHRLGDDAERSFGAPQNAHQVKARIVQGLAAHLDDLSVGQDQLHPEDVVAGHPVFQTVGPPGILGEVSPDRRHLFARGIGLVEITVFGQHILQIQRDHAGLDDNALIFDIHIENLIHLCQDDGDAAPNSHASPAEVRPRSPGDDRNFMIMGKCDDPRHLLR